MINYNRTNDFETFKLPDMVFCKRFYNFKNPITGLDENILIPVCKDYSVGILSEITLEEYDICKSIYHARNIIKEIFLMSNSIYPVEQKISRDSLDFGAPPEVAMDIISKRYGYSILHFLASCEKI